MSDGGGSAAGEGADVTVVTLTFRRPDDLRDALPLLLEQVESVPRAELLVVDNDEEPTARAVVEEYAGRPVRYVHEPRPGIAAARNRGLDEAAGSEVVVFVDDDERPCEDWLRTLLATFRKTGCTGVVGPVLSVFDGPVDPWIVAGGYFTRLRHPTGTVVRVAATNNLLLDARAVRTWGLRFDEQFGLSGGSDTVFALELAARGGRLVWSDEAAVLDVVPPSRATRSWVVRRAFRMGNTGSRAAVHVRRSVVARTGVRLTTAARGLVRVLGGGARWGWGCVARDLRSQARGARTAVRGAGMLLGAFGYVYAEYARTSAPARRLLRTGS